LIGSWEFSYWFQVTGCTGGVFVIRYWLFVSGCWFVVNRREIARKETIGHKKHKKAQKALV